MLSPSQGFSGARPPEGRTGATNTAPHVAGVTREVVDRMGTAAVEDILSVLDGKPIRDNGVYKELLD